MHRYIPLISVLRDLNTGSNGSFIILEATSNPFFFRKRYLLLFSKIHIFYLEKYLITTESECVIELQQLSVFQFCSQLSRGC